LKKILFYFLLYPAVSQVYSQYIAKATITSIGSTTLNLKDQGENLEIQQSIGQSSIIGTKNFNKTSVQQGFLNTIKIFDINNLDIDFIETSLIVVISPNPFIDHIKIKFSETTKHEIHIKIYNFNGQLLFSKKFNATASLRIPMKYYRTGSYLIQVQSGPNTFSKKLLKHRFNE